MSKFVYLIVIVASAVSAQYFENDFFSIDAPPNARQQNHRINIESLSQQYILLEKRVAQLENKIVHLQHATHGDWNQTDSGSMFKLFAERKDWEEAENYCQTFGGHLATIDNEVKNKFINALIKENPTSDYVWIGLKTTATATIDRDSFSNFAAESPIHGCAVMDSTGVWSIRSCGQLRPFICQIIAAR
ncbi:unnamed protein product [Auanema sp. JU1783]|nr:unnamed protein product [Auanema sp. JU1783]